MKVELLYRAQVIFIIGYQQAESLKVAMMVDGYNAMVNGHCNWWKMPLSFVHTYNHPYH